MIAFGAQQDIHAQEEHKLYVVVVSTHFIE